MQTNSTSTKALSHAGLAIKEVLRGVRHIAFAARKIGVGILSLFPGFIRRPSDRLVEQVDQLAERVDERVSAIAHRYFDPDIARDSENTTFSKIVCRQDAALVFAKVSYDNLKFAKSYLAPKLGLERDFFISEFLSACAFRKAHASDFAAEDDFINAANVLLQLKKQGAIRTDKSANASKSNDPKVVQLADIACFAHILWLLIARDYHAAREYDLLLACCDLCSVIYGQILEAGDDSDKIAELLKVHAELV